MDDPKLPNALVEEASPAETDATITQKPGEDAKFTLWSRILALVDLSGYQATSGKNASGGYVGLTLFKIMFRNAADTFTSFFTNANTAVRNYTFQDRDGTIADNTDVANAITTANAYTDASKVGLWNDRGNFDASVNAYPSSGGSGAAGAIKKGDIWTISVAGTLPTGQVVAVGDTVRAKQDTPGNTQANWAIQENNIGYVAENSTNKSTDNTLGGGASSDTLYPSQKAVHDNLANTGYLKPFATWNASTNTPHMSDGTPLEPGAIYETTVAGASGPDGITNIMVGDKLYFDVVALVWRRMVGDRLVYDFATMMGDMGYSNPNTGITNHTIKLLYKATVGFTMDKISYVTDAGTVTLVVKIDGVAVTWASALSADNTDREKLSTADFTVAAGQTVTVELSSASLDGLYFNIQRTRT